MLFRLYGQFSFLDPEKDMAVLLDCSLDIILNFSHRLWGSTFVT